MNLNIDFLPTSPVPPPRLPREAPAVYTAPTGRAAYRRLDANEGPPPPDGFLSAALAAAAPNVTFYPEYTELREAAARAWGVPAPSVLPVNGADEGIRLWLEAVGGPGAPLLLPEPTFPMYRVSAGLTGTPVVSVPLGPDFGLDAESVAEALPRAAALALVSPGNPSGRRIGEAVLRGLLAAAGGRPVLVDEVYGPFCGQDFTPLLAEFPNVALLRSLSKAYGVPGLRCGFILAGPALANRLELRRPPYNVSSVAASVGAVLLADDGDAPRRRRAAVEARQALQGWLAAAGVPTSPSDTHFCLLRLGASSGAAVRRLESQGILVRDLGGALPGWIRVSVTGRADADAFAAAFLPWWCGRRLTGGQP